MSQNTTIKIYSKLVHIDTPVYLIIKIFTITVLGHAKPCSLVTARVWAVSTASVCRLTCRHHVSYTGCNRRKGPDFGRVFLMLNYTEKPQNTYIQS